MNIDPSETLKILNTIMDVYYYQINTENEASALLGVVQIILNLQEVKTKKCH